MSCWVTQQDSDSASKEGKGREEKRRKGRGGEGKEMGRAVGKREGQGCHELSTPMGTRCSMICGRFLYQLSRDDGILQLTFFSSF